MIRSFRKLFWILWICFPVIIAVWYYRSGPEAFQYDLAGSLADQAYAAAVQGDYKNASELYLESQKALPAKDVKRHLQLRLAELQSRIRTEDILTGSEQLSEFLLDLPGDVPEKLKQQVRSELAASYYHTSLLMRQEGAGSDEWLPIIQQARQQYRVLAETGTGNNNQQNLEAAIKLQRMDQSLIQGLPLPKKCPKNCNDLSQRKRKQRQNKGKQKKSGNDQKDQDKKNQGQKDARQQITQQKINTAGMNQAEGGGS